MLPTNMSKHANVGVPACPRVRVCVRACACNETGKQRQAWRASKQHSLPSSSPSSLLLLASRFEFQFQFLTRSRRHRTCASRVFIFEIAYERRALRIRNIFVKTEMWKLMCMIFWKEQIKNTTKCVRQEKCKIRNNQSEKCSQAACSNVFSVHFHRDLCKQTRIAANIEWNEHNQRQINSNKNNS